ncbi:MAG: FHA domain-containing protein [Armatimonadetes bacterium]|nr:FHA domain-containing protein [Armatimonadota bacterium]
MRGVKRRQASFHDCAVMVVRWLTICVALVLVTMNAGCQGQQEQVRVSELANYLGQRVTIKGRTGQILEGYQTLAFTLRDDYGDMVIVLLQSGKPYPIMGATYYVTGIVKQSEGKTMLTDATYRRWYGWLTLPAVIIIAIFVIGLGITYLIIRRHVSRRVEAVHEEVFAEPWAFVEVVAGRFDHGKRFALRYDEIPIGREADPSIGILLDDTAVSRRHGRILRDSSGRIMYEDLGSTYGSWVNEEQVRPNQPVHLPEGALIRLGPETIIRLSPVHAARGETHLAGQEGMRTGQPEGDGRPTVPQSDREQTPPPREPDAEN